VRDVLGVLTVFTFFWVVGIDDFGSGLEECLILFAEEIVQGEILLLAVGGAIVRCLASRASHSCSIPTNSAFGRSHLSNDFLPNVPSFCCTVRRCQLELFGKAIRFAEGELRWNPSHRPSLNERK
jgi:hypothetical protein